MVEHLIKNWMVYVLIAGFVWFVMSVYRNAKQQEKMKQEHNKAEDKQAK